MRIKDGFVLRGVTGQAVVIAIGEQGVLRND